MFLMFGSGADFAADFRPSTASRPYRLGIKEVRNVPRPRRGLVRLCPRRLRRPALVAGRAPMRDAHRPVPFAMDRPGGNQNRGAQSRAHRSAGGKGSAPSAPLLCTLHDRAIISVAGVTSGTTAHGRCVFWLRAMHKRPSEAAHFAPPKSGRSGASGGRAVRDGGEAVYAQRLDVCPGNKAPPVGNEGISGEGGIGAAGSRRR